MKFNHGAFVIPNPNTTYDETKFGIFFYYEDYDKLISEATHERLYENVYKKHPHEVVVDDDDNTTHYRVTEDTDVNALTNDVIAFLEECGAEILYTDNLTHEEWVERIDSASR